MFLSSIIDNQAFQIGIWLLLFIITLVIEVTTSDLVSIWFSGGSLISLILAICNVPFLWQIVTLCVISGILLFVSKIWIKRKLLKDKEIATNIDAMIGQEIIVTKDASKEIPGEGKIRDVIWTISCDDNSVFKKGEFAIIKSIKGNKLIVKKKEEK